MVCWTFYRKCDIMRQAIGGGNLLTKLDFENMDNKLKEILEQSVDEIELNTEFPPTIDYLVNKNEAYSIMAAILFIDIRKSTDLTENSRAKSMVKIYRAFMRMCVECVRKNGGVTRNFLGDRIMAVFMDSKTEDGKIIKAMDKALNCAISMATAIDYSLNKNLKSSMNNKTIDCGIGIDYGKVLLTKVGMYGVESDETKENEVDCVWVGNVTNHASKFSDLAQGGEIFISKNAYENLGETFKDVKWEEITKYKGKKAYNGYISKFIYCDFADELELCNNRESINIENDEISMIIANSIKEIDRIKDEIKKKEIDLAVKEEKNRKNLNEIKDLTSELYNLIFDFIGLPFYNKFKVDKEMLNFWIEIINLLFEVGKKKGYSIEEIKISVAYYLIEIYNYLQMFDKAFEYMIIMIKNNSWVYLKDETLQWAKDKGKLWELKWEINWRVEYNANYIDTEEFKKYIEEVDKYE